MGGGAWDYCQGPAWGHSISTVTLGAGTDISSPVLRTQRHRGTERERETETERERHRERERDEEKQWQGAQCPRFARVRAPLSSLSLVSWPCRPGSQRPWGSGLSSEPGCDLAVATMSGMPSPPPSCLLSALQQDSPATLSLLSQYPQPGLPYSSPRNTSASLVLHSGAHNSPGAG